MSFKVLVNSNVLYLRFRIIVNLVGASSDLSSPHSHIDGSKGSKTTVNLLKEFERLNVVRTWRVRVEFIGHRYNLVQLYRCNKRQSVTIATNHLIYRRYQMKNNILVFNIKKNGITTIVNNTVITNLRNTSRYKYNIRSFITECYVSIFFAVINFFYK